jgi:hypothetical protein
MDEVADLVNRRAGKNVWDARQARRILGRAGAIVKLGHLFVTTRHRLRDALPELWMEIMLELGDSEDDQDSEDLARPKSAGS